MHNGYPRSTANTIGCRHGARIARHSFICEVRRSAHHLVNLDLGMVFPLHFLLTMYPSSDSIVISRLPVTCGGRGW